jgi:guanine deaminase
MLIAGQLLLADQGNCRIAPGMVRIEDDSVVEVIVGDCSPRADVGGPDCLIAPGFIDTHLHLPQLDAIGAQGLSLLEWLGQVIYAAEARWESPGFAAEMTGRAIRQCLRHGTTGFCAYATVHPAAAEQALRVAQAAQMRGVIGQVLMDREAPAALCRPAPQLIAETAELLDRFPPGGRIAAAVTPRFAISCSEDLLRLAGQLATDRGAIVQTHLAETVAECARVGELFGGRSYVEVYREAGLLGPRSFLGHGIHLDDTDRRQLAASQARVAHCPLANSFLHSGTMSRRQLIDAGVGITLGSDIGAGYELSMIRVARAMIEAAVSLGDPPPTAARAWHTITAGNAEQLGWSDAGRLVAGAVADLLVIRPDIPWTDGPVDPLSRLLFAWDDRWLTEVYLRGRRVY